VVYVTAKVSSGYGTTIYALEQATGATLWSHSLGGVYNSSGLAYDGGQVFALNNSGVLTAYDASTGATDWSITLSTEGQFTNPPSTGNGLVYAGGGSTVYAVSEQSGVPVWKADAPNGDDESSPVVTSTGVYVTYGCDDDYDFNPFTGQQIWHYDANCTGGGGTTPVLANGDIFGRDSASGNVILSGGAGSDLGTFASTYAPAAGAGDLYTASPGTLTALSDWGLGSSSWSFSGDSHIDTAPLIDGSLLFEGSSSGELYAVNAANGTTAWSTDTGDDIPAPDEINPSQPLTGLGVGEDTLIVPAGSTLLAYAGANVGSGIPSVSEAPTVSGTPVATEAVGADVGVWSALPTGYTYQWALCDSSGANCSNISTDGTGESYTPSNSDIGDTLEVTVTATNTGGTSSDVTSAPSSSIVEPPPASQTVPSISGTALPGDTLTAAPGTWSNSPTSYDYQWLRCQSSICDPVAGATSSTYLVSSADAPSGLEVQVTANNATGSALASSSATAEVPSSTTITITSSANPVATGVSVTLTAKISPALDGGTVAITQNGQAIPGCPPFAITDSVISVSCVGPFEQAGSYTITATYSGTGGWLGSSASLTQIVTGSSSSAAPVGVVLDGFPSSLVNSPVINYTESGPVTSTVCTIDAVATPCSSAQATLSNLATGHHIFAVTVSGGDGSAVAQVSWEITTSTQVAKVTGKKSKSHKKPKKKKKPTKDKPKKHKKKKTKKTKKHKG
jgi:outer membrane protein assembly factor BamB